MVVISGHHEQGFYRGELTDAKVKEFIDMMEENRALFTRSIPLCFLACEAGTKTCFRNTLLAMFPSVPVILASEDNAPTRNEARNLAYIRHVVSIRPKLLAARTVKEVQPLLTVCWLKTGLPACCGVKISSFSKNQQSCFDAVFRLSFEPVLKLSLHSRPVFR